MKGELPFPKCIWMYWENKPFTRKPDYLNLCVETIEKYKGDFELRLLNEKSVTQYLDIPPKVWKLKEIAHRADYIRFHLLREYGGVWLDADLVLIRDLKDAIFPYIEQFDFVGYGREQGKPSINFMACRRGCELISNQACKVDLVLEQKQVGVFQRKLDLQWTEIGHDIFWELAQNYSYYHHPLDKMAPIFWRDWRLFFSEDMEINEILEKQPFLVMLYNDFMYKELKGRSKKQLLESDDLLGKMFRYALGT